MFKYVLTSLKGYKKAYLKDDIIAGVIVAALTIPVAMGYAQIAGLPPVYGLYGSILPVIGYALFASNPQLIYGVDASAAAITGSLVATVGLAAGSQDVLDFVPVAAVCTGVFLILFAVLKLGRFAGYISAPVMSGFITGLSLSVMFSQLPKMFGLDASGLIGTLQNITQLNATSLLLSVVTVAALLVCKKLLPKIPSSLLLMVAGTALTALLRLDKLGVVIVGDIPDGLPTLILPNFTGPHTLAAVAGGFVLAVVIFADSLLTTTSFAIQGKYPIKPNRELFAFGASNLFAGFSGCSPTSASVSRTAAGKQYRAKTQLVSLVAAGVIALVCAFLSGLLYYMPQPLLSGIVFVALLGVLDFGALKALLHESKREAVIWIITAVGVLVLDVLPGVLIGVVLSFIHVIMKVSAPDAAYLGVIQGREGFFDMTRHKEAKPLPGISIFRFSARLFFANSERFQKGVRKAMNEKPRAIILDARGINSIDTTAADDLKNLLSDLDEAHIQYFFAEQTSDLVDDFSEKGLGFLQQNGRLKRSIEEALQALGEGPAPPATS